MAQQLNLSDAEKDRFESTSNEYKILASSRITG
jgi:hypothetical protein